MPCLPFPSLATTRLQNSPTTIHSIHSLLFPSIHIRTFVKSRHSSRLRDTSILFHDLSHEPFATTSCFPKHEHNCASKLLHTAFLPPLLPQTIAFFHLPGRSQREITSSDVSNSRSLTKYYRPVWHPSVARTDDLLHSVSPPVPTSEWIASTETGRVTSATVLRPSVGSTAVLLMSQRSETIPLSSP
jgi:hypothetical protein